MSKAKRQMPEQSGRVSVAHGEAVRDPISDEAYDPLSEHPDIGSAKSMAGTGGLTLPLFPVVVSPRFTRLFYAVP